MIKNIKTKETIKDIKTLDKKKMLDSFNKSKVLIQKIMYRIKRKIRSQIMQ